MKRPPDTTDTPAAPPTITVTDLVKTFPTGLTAIDHVTMTIPTGSLVAVTGPSGSGKSTLLHLIGGIEAATEGTIEVGHTDITKLRRGALTAYRRQLGFVFQRYHLLPALTALDNVITPALPYRTSYDKVARGRDLLAAVGLAGREHSLPTRMSGGQQQRIAIARALMNHPHTLIADEPTGNLDTATGHEIIDLITTLQREHGMTVLIATHDPDLAARCDTTIHIIDGKLI